MNSLTAHYGQQPYTDRKLGSPSEFVKALVYLAYDYTRTRFSRASAYLNVSLKVLESRNLTEYPILTAKLALLRQPQICLCPGTISCYNIFCLIPIMSFDPIKE